MYAAYKSRNLPMPPIPTNAYVTVVSMWPTYISLLISVSLIFILIRNSIKS